MGKKNNQPQWLRKIIISHNGLENKQPQWIRKWPTCICTYHMTLIHVHITYDCNTCAYHMTIIHVHITWRYYMYISHDFTYNLTLLLLLISNDWSKKRKVLSTDFLILLFWLSIELAVSQSGSNISGRYDSTRLMCSTTVNYWY